MADLMFKEGCFKIVGLAMKVHTRLGRGFKEVVYKDALEVEFIKHKIPYEREKTIYQFHYDNFNQTLNYLKASQVKLGVLINLENQTSTLSE